MAKRSKRGEIVQRGESSYGDLLTDISGLLDQARRMSARSVDSIRWALSGLVWQLDGTFAAYYAVNSLFCGD